MAKTATVSIRVLDMPEMERFTEELQVLRRVARCAALHVMSDCTAHRDDLQVALMTYQSLEKHS